MGAGFVVTQNERLDYFGTAVDIAARAQHEARGGEMVMTEEAFREATTILPSDSYRVEPFTAALRGIACPVQLFRIVGTADKEPAGFLALPGSQPNN